MPFKVASKKLQEIYFLLLLQNTAEAGMQNQNNYICTVPLQYCMRSIRLAINPLDRNVNGLYPWKVEINEDLHSRNRLFFLNYD